MKKKRKARSGLFLLKGITDMFLRNSVRLGKRLFSTAVYLLFSPQ